MENKKIDLTIITPFYKGNAFVDARLKVVENIALKSKKNLFEWIIVNDSPAEKVKKIKTTLTNLTIRVIFNTVNVGIHQSRINGLKKAHGMYVVFLDQDDYLSPFFWKFQKNFIQKADVSICNGFNENNSSKKMPIFKTRLQMRILKNISTYFYLGNLIISPGMALIKKNSIVKEWINNRMKINGADDWLLWVLMLSKKRKFVYCPYKLYIHQKTNKNVSSDNQNMIRSCEEALQIFASLHPEHSDLSKVYNRRLHMWQNYKIEDKNKYYEYLKNPDIALFQLSYKLRGL